MRNLENVSSKIWLTGFFNFEASTHGRQFILLKEDCSPFYVRNSRIESRLINVKGKDPLVVHRCYSFLPKPIDTSSNMFKSLLNLEKKNSRSFTWRIPISQPPLSTKLHNDQIPTTLSNTSNNFHHKFLQIVNSLIIDRSLALHWHVKFKHVFNSSTPRMLCRVNVCFSSSLLLKSCFVTRNYSFLVNSPYFSSPDPGQALALVDPAPGYDPRERRPSWPKKRSGRVRRGSQSWIVCRSRCRLGVQAAKACSIGGTTQASSGSRGVVCDSSSLFDHPACSRLGRLSTRGWRIHHVVLLAK